MNARDARRKRRLWAAGLYAALYVLTFVGSGRAEPQLLGIPLWYWGAGLVVLLLVPLNWLFVRYAWPSEDTGV